MHSNANNSSCNEGIENVNDYIDSSNKYNDPKEDDETVSSLRNPESELAQPSNLMQSKKQCSDVILSKPKQKNAEIEKVIVRFRAVGDAPIMKVYACALILK